MSGSWSNTGTSLIILTEEISGFSGLFGYSPFPAKGNLVFSVTASNGTDPYGNDYISGVAVYNESARQFAQLVAGAALFGIIESSGAPDTADAGEIFATVVSGLVDIAALSIQSPVILGAPDRATLQLNSGFDGQPSGAMHGPQVVIADGNSDSAVDGMISGNWFAAGLTGGATGPTTPVLNAGFTNDNLVYQPLPVGTLHWQGEITMAAAQGAAGALAIYTLPPGLKPLNEVIVPASWRNSGGLSKGAQAFFSFETSGIVMLGWSGATAANDRFSCSVDFLTVVPLDI